MYIKGSGANHEYCKQIRISPLEYVDAKGLFRRGICPHLTLSDPTIDGFCCSPLALLRAASFGTLSSSTGALHPLPPLKCGITMGTHTLDIPMGEGRKESDTGRRHYKVAIRSRASLRMARGQPMFSRKRHWVASSSGSGEKAVPSLRATFAFSIRSRFISPCFNP